MAGVCVSLLACGEPADPRDSEDLLVLELGGDHEALSRALLRLRGTPAPAAGPAAAPAAGPTAGPTGEGAVETPLPAAERQAEAEPPPPEIFSVYLRQGETLYGLARTHLGSGARWRELLELNGWSEAQAGQLPVGTMVKLPIR